MKIAAFIICFLAILIAGLWIIAVPESLITDSIEDSLDTYNIEIEMEDFRKGLFYTVMAEKIIVSSKDPGIPDPRLLIIDSVKARLDLVSLLKLRPVIRLDCMVNSGQVKGAVGLGNDRELTISGRGIVIDGIPFFESLGIKGEGHIALDISMLNREGAITLSSDDAKLRNIFYKGIFLPLETFSKVRGKLDIKNDTLEVKSFGMEGDGIFARIKGRVAGRQLDMQMELMMDSTFESEYILRPMLEQYLVSPGYYTIPLRTSF